MEIEFVNINLQYFLSFYSIVLGYSMKERVEIRLIMQLFVSFISFWNILNCAWISFEI